jgi:hypothetical protein
MVQLPQKQYFFVFLDGLSSSLKIVWLFDQNMKCFYVLKEAKTQFFWMFLGGAMFFCVTENLITIKEGVAK